MLFNFGEVSGFIYVHFLAGLNLVNFAKVILKNLLISSIGWESGFFATGHGPWVQILGCS